MMAWLELVRVCGPSRALPLHEACHGGGNVLETKTIELLVRLWPELVRESRKNEQLESIWLPLHDALSNATVSLDIIQFLVQQGPESIKVPIKDNMVVIHWACQNGASLPVIRFLAEQWPKSV